MRSRVKPLAPLPVVKAFAIQWPDDQPTGRVVPTRGSDRLPTLAGAVLNVTSWSKTRLPWQRTPAAVSCSR